MTNTTTIAVGCKINLFLYITARRDNGYHELDTLFFPLPKPGDTLELRPGAPKSGLKLTCSKPKLAGENNLVAKAYRKFADRTGFKPDLHVHLVKESPIGAGLGGGSADCAAMLTYLNGQAGNQALGEAELAALAATLGADVPFFLLNTPARATGIGEVLTPVAVDMAGLSLVLITPAVHVSTAWAYQTHDVLGQPSTRPGNIAEDFLTGAGETDSYPIRPGGMALANDFERVVLPAFPELSELKQELASQGAAQAVMSGSGAALFGLFDRREEAEKAKEHFLDRQISAYAFHF